MANFVKVKKHPRYKGVFEIRMNKSDEVLYRCKYKGKFFIDKEPRKVAVKYDEFLLMNGKKAVNVLKKKV